MYNNSLVNILLFDFSNMSVVATIYSEKFVQMLHHNWVVYIQQTEGQGHRIQPLSALCVYLNDNINSVIKTGNSMSNIYTIVVSESLVGFIERV